MNQSLLRYGLPLVAMGFLLFALRSALSQPEPVATSPAIKPPVSPFDAAVAGLGIIEPSSELIAVAPHLSGVIAHVAVRPGQTVRTGEILFNLDVRDIDARISAARIRLESARIAASDAAGHAELYRAIADPRAVSRDELDRRQYAEALAARGVDEARARLRVLETERERLFVRAPISGTVLAVKARPGEFAQAGKTQEALVTLGNLHPLHVRVEIDETEIARMGAGRTAIARLRGDTDHSSALTFVRTEPLLKPKRTLTGDGNERIDTRVQEIIYALRDPAFPARIGQQVDVYIEAGKAGMDRVHPVHAGGA